MLRLQYIIKVAQGLRHFCAQSRVFARDFQLVGRLLCRLVRDCFFKARYGLGQLLERLSLIRFSHRNRFTKNLPLGNAPPLRGRFARAELRIDRR